MHGEVAQLPLFRFVAAGRQKNSRHNEKKAFADHLLTPLPGTGMAKEKMRAQRVARHEASSMPDW